MLRQINACHACNRDECLPLSAEKVRQLRPLETGNTMATYVTLYSFTDQGIRDIKDTVKRVEAAKKAAKNFGVTIKEVLWTQGQCDLVVISEGSDEVSANALMLSTVKLGNVRGATMRAFTAAEMEKVLAKVV
jgi:uncharacterized protein with GYD domain